MNKKIYVFKVLYRRGIWRRIQLYSEYTLHNLNEVILKAYDFDNDHLYGFFMEGKPWQGTAYWSPFNDEGPYANEIKIKSLNLHIKQKFLYLYDFVFIYLFCCHFSHKLHCTKPV